MKLHLPLRLRAGLLVYALPAFFALPAQAALTVTNDIQLDDGLTNMAWIGGYTADTTYGSIAVGNVPLTFSELAITVSHDETSGTDQWAGFYLSGVNLNGGSQTYSFTNTTLQGDGNLAFAFRSNGGQPKADFSTLNGNVDGSEFTGRILVVNPSAHGLFATYAGTSLQYAEFVLATSGTSYTIGNTSIMAGSNSSANILRLEGDGTLAGITAEANNGKNVLRSLGAGVNTLTLTGGQNRNGEYVFAGDAGLADNYLNIVQQGGSQTFSGTNLFGSVSVTGGSLTLSSNTTVYNDVTVTGGSLNVSGSMEGTSSTYTANGGAINVTGESGTISNSAVSVARNGSTEASIQNATVGTTSIEKTTGDGAEGSVQNAHVTVKAEAYAIKNVNLSNSLVDLQSTGTVTLENVTIGAGTSVSNTGGGIINLVNTTVDLQSAAGAVTLNNVTIGAGTSVVNAAAGTVTLNNAHLVMTADQTTVGMLNTDTHTLSVTSSALAGYTTISGTLTFDLTKEWIDNLVSSVEGDFTKIELSFTGVSEATWTTFQTAGGELSQAGALDYPMFGPPTVTFGDGTGTVIIAATTNIPEPATATLGLLGLSSLLLRRRRKA